MFSRKSKEGAKTPPAAPAPAPKKTRVSETPMVSAPVRAAVPSIISGDLVVTGHLVSGGELQVDGTIDGDVRAASLVIGEQATITGEVLAEEVVVRGRVIGTIRGMRVVLTASCHVEGDITHESLAVEPGAFFEGACRRSEDPLAAHDRERIQSAEKPRQNAPEESRSTAPVRGKPKPKPKRTAPKLTEADPARVVVKDGSIVVRRPSAE